MRKSHLLLLVAISATGVAARTLWWTGTHQGRPGARPPGLFSPDQVAANGVVEGAAPAVELRTELLGTIAAVHYRENEWVAKGSVLAELNSESQREQVGVAAAEALVAAADLDRVVNGERPERRKAAADAEAALKVAYDHAEAKWKRAKTEADRGIGVAAQFEEVTFALARARAEYERAKAERAVVDAPARADEVTAARARLGTAEARLRLAKAELARTRLLAPSDGTVLQRFAEPGDMAGPTSTRPILVLADLSRLRVRAFVEELDAGRTRPGQPAVVTADGLPGHEFRGTVAAVLPRMSRVAPQSDAPGEYKDVYFREVLIDLDRGQELPISLRVRVRIDTRPPERPANSTAGPDRKPDDEARWASGGRGPVPGWILTAGGHAARILTATPRPAVEPAPPPRERQP